MTEDGLALLYPNPDAFFAGNLQINQLTELVAELDLACDEMKSRMEAQLLGSVVSTYIGTAKPSADIRVTEAYDLRDLVAANIEKNITGTGKRCFEAGLTESLSNQSLSRHVQWDAPQRIVGMAEIGSFW